MMPLNQTLPVLDALCAEAMPLHESLRGVTVIGVQHLLSSTTCLVRALIRLGVPPDQIALIGKPYSTNLDVAEELRGTGVLVRSPMTGWRLGYFADWFKDQVRALLRETRPLTRESRRIVLLDDGGFLRSMVRGSRKHDVVAVEQTTSGMRVRSQVPTIAVARCAAKLEAEPPLIARAACDALWQRIVPKQATVVGFGAIGRAVAAELDSRGVTVLVSDRARSRQRGIRHGAFRDSRDALASSPLIIGCTGADLSFHAADCRSTQSQYLVSCSSGDAEFRSFLRNNHFENNDGLSDLTVPEPRVTLLRGGFPINFTGAQDSVPPEDIQLTRGLLLGGVLQAATIDAAASPSTIMLDAGLQSFVVQTWLRQKGTRSNTDERLRRSFRDPRAVAARSAGTIVRGSLAHVFTPN